MRALRDEENKGLEKTAQRGALRFAFHTKYYTVDQSRRRRWAENVARIGKRTGVYMV